MTNSGDLLWYHQHNIMIKQEHITYKPLQTDCVKNGFRLTQLYREGDFAIFHKVGIANLTRQKDVDVGFEVVIVARHNGYELGGVKIEPAETYPCSSQWGAMGWTYRTLMEAEQRFGKLINGEIKVTNNIVSFTDAKAEETESVAADAPKASVPSSVNIANLNIPDGEFTTAQLAEFNKTDYTKAFLFIKDALNRGTVKFLRDESKEEREGRRGKPRKFFTKS